MIASLAPPLAAQNPKLAGGLRLPAYGGLFVLALLPRILYLLIARPPFDSHHWALSESLLKDGSLSLNGARTTGFEPGYAVFLAVARAVVGDRMLAVQAIQCVVAALGALFLYRLATVLTGRWQIGAIAAFLYAAYPLLVRHSADGSDAAVMTTLLIAFTGEFVAATTPARAAGAGLCLGLTVLTRMMALPLVPLAAALQWRRHGWRTAAALMLTACVVIAPYSIRNYTLNGSPWPTRSGLNLFISTSVYTPRLVPDYGVDILEDYALSVVNDDILARQVSPARLERELSAVWTRFALAELRRDPAGTLGLKAKNVVYFFSPWLVPSHVPTEATEIQLGENGQSVVDNSPPRPIVDQIVYTISYMPVLALAVAGIWLRRHDLRADAILWCVLVTFVAVHAVYFPATRYRVPVEFVLLFYAAVALDRAMPRIRAAGSPTG